VITGVVKRKADVTNSFALIGTLEEDKHFRDEELKVD